MITTNLGVNSGHSWRSYTVRGCATALLLVSAVLHPGGARADEILDRKISLEIPDNTTLESALIEWGTVSGLAVMINTKTVDHHFAPKLRGTRSAREALDMLLKGSGLSYTRDGARILVVAAGSITRSSWQSTSGSEYSNSDIVAADSGNAVSSENADDSGGLDGERSRRNELPEVVVTANKRSENLLEVPASVSALSGDRLQELQVSTLADVANFVPGLAIQNAGNPGENQIVIRGLSGAASSGGAPLVGIYVDDTPVSNSSGFLGSGIGFDLNPFDLDRVEVLRGPQGTLYGANAMGGLIKYVLRKPDLTQFAAGVGGDIEGVNSGGRPGGGGRVFVNAPILTDQLAVRASGFYTDSAGFIDNVALGTRNTNSSVEKGARVTLLWQPFTALAVQASLLSQNIHSADTTNETLNGTTFQPAYGPQTKFQYFAEPYTQILRDYLLNINWDLSFATLTSASSWSHMHYTENEDVSESYGIYAPNPPGLVNYVYGGTLSKGTEELRLTSPADRRVAWMFGAIYTKEDSTRFTSGPTYTLTYQPYPEEDNLFLGGINDSYRERAVFGNATYKVVEAFDVSGGARYSENAESGCTPVWSGVFQPPSSRPPCLDRPYQSVTTWMANSRYHVSETSMLYVRFATGFRPSAINGIVPGAPYSSSPDKTTNYEFGVKGEVFDHHLQIDAAVFHISWKDIQLQTYTPEKLYYIGNGGGAVSSGLELTTSFSPTPGLRFTATLDYTDAHLTDDAPIAFGKAGDRLPDAPRVTGSLATDYSRQLIGGYELIVGGSYRYKDWTPTQFEGAAGSFSANGPQNIVDIHWGVGIGGATLQLYGKNIFNNRSYTGGVFTGSLAFPSYVPIQPRTFGLSADYRF